jgi:hypothetical protein
VKKPGAASTGNATPCTAHTHIGCAGYIMNRQVRHGVCVFQPRAAANGASAPWGTWVAMMMMTDKVLFSKRSIHLVFKALQWCCYRVRGITVTSGQ